jgi:hypothetical protein
MVDELNLLKRCCHCYQQTYFIGYDWVRKVRCLRCLLCDRPTQSSELILTGVGDGWEICSNPSCNYRRLVFSDKEMQQLRW